MAISKTNFIKSKKSGANYIYAILGVAAVLFLLGMLGWIGIYAREVSKTFKEAIEIEVIFNDNTRDSLGVQLLNEVNKYEFTKSAKYITKEEAAKLYQGMNNENVNEVIEFNPLYSSIILHLNAQYVNIDSMNNIAKLLKKSNIVREVQFNNNLIDLASSNAKKIGAALLGITILFTLLVIFMIDNTIKLAMYSQRFLIKTMQFVGATRWFISKPFTIRAIINGLISAAIAIVALIIFQQQLCRIFTELSAYKAGTPSFLLYGSIVLLGVLITVISTHRSVIKYLKTSLDELY
jgi:cell division transport system permease protein